MLPSRNGVALVRPDDIVGGSFGHIFVLGMSEGVYPQPPSEDPVVDFFERGTLRSHGIKFASAAEVSRWEELSFYFTLLASQGHIRFSFPRIIGKDEALQSSFFQRLGIEKVPAATAANIAASCEEYRSATLRQDTVTNGDGVIERARHSYKVELSRETAPLYDEYDGVIGVPMAPTDTRWSASQLVAIGQCSFGWFSKYVLRLKPQEELADGLEASTLGSLYHKALEIAVGRAIGSSDIRQQTLANLSEAFAEAEADPEVGLPPIANWDVRRKAFFETLKKAVASPAFIADGAEVLAVEKEFKTTWNGFPLRGWIDRIDSTPTGLVAIDYKTSRSAPKGAKDEAGDLKVDVQIPLYANVALAELYPDGEFGESYYYSLTKGDVLGPKRNRPNLETLETFIERIRDILSQGSFAVDPDEKGDACTYCEFLIVCRKGSRLRRKSRQ
jgi:RecB family exonuclease